MREAWRLIEEGRWGVWVGGGDCGEWRACVVWAAFINPGNHGYNTLLRRTLVQEVGLFFHL
jgi:hypothetical protein